MFEFAMPTDGKDGFEGNEPAIVSISQLTDSASRLFPSSVSKCLPRHRLDLPGASHLYLENKS